MVDGQKGGSGADNIVADRHFQVLIVQVVIADHREIVPGQRQVGEATHIPDIVEGLDGWGGAVEVVTDSEFEDIVVQVVIADDREAEAVECDGCEPAQFSVSASSLSIDSLVCSP